MRVDRRIYGPGPTRASRVLLARPGRDYRTDPSGGVVEEPVVEAPSAAGSPDDDEPADLELVDEVGDVTAPPSEDQLEHVGGGMWLLPDGRRIRGRAAALEALAAGKE